MSRTARVVVSSLMTLTMNPSWVLACLDEDIGPAVPTPTYVLVLWAVLAVLVVALFTHKRLEAFFQEWARADHGVVRGLLSQGRTRLATTASYGCLALALCLTLAGSSVEILWQQSGCSDLFGRPSIVLGRAK